VEIPQNQSLHDDIDDFWHYGKIARYDMAAAFGNKILSRSEPPLEVLRMFETVANQHEDNLDDWLLRWEGVTPNGMKGIAIKIQALLSKGRSERRKDPKYIQENIEALATNERAYRIHIERLRESGELAVPLMLDYLRDKDPSKAAFKDPIRRALVDLGRPILNPLVAATETKDDDLQLTLISVLSRIGYDVAVPYLSRIAQDNTKPGLAIAASDALRRMGASANNNLADQFYRLAEKFYYNNAAIAADPKAPVAYMWFWGNAGLTYKEVPPAIFTDLMSERESEYALRLGPGTRDALSLWLSANNKVEVDLPEGASPGVWDQSRPSANYFNVYAGAQYLNAALTRSLEDHNAPVALKLIKSLGEIVGPSSQGTGVRLDPLVQSMRYPDRQVRFEAAFALAAGLPNNPFPGHERVAPLLAEAVSQTGSANVLIVAPSQADEQKLAAELKQYGIAMGINAGEAVTNSLKLPSVDVIVFPETLGNAQIDRIYELCNQTPRLERAAKVIITTSKLSPWAERTLSDPLTVVTQATDDKSLTAAVEEARKHAGGLPLDEKVATTYAIRGAQTLQRLAEGRVTSFDLTVVQPTLLASLNDKRPEVVKAVGDALAYMNSDEIQGSVLGAAIAEKTSDDVRISLLKSLAKNAKFFGKRVSTEALNDLQKLVDTAPNLDVRTAAAEARGAFNLSADQAKEMIVKQSKR
jgi:HEAT repeat protein